MNDKIKINLQMAGASYPLTINREDEEMVREAAKQVDIRLNAYREHYQKWWVMRMPIILRKSLKRRRGLPRQSIRRACRCDEKSITEIVNAKEE